MKKKHIVTMGATIAMSLAAQAADRPTIIAPSPDDVPSVEDISNQDNQLIDEINAKEVDTLSDLLNEAENTPPAPVAASTDTEVQLPTGIEKDAEPLLGSENGIDGDDNIKFTDAPLNSVIELLAERAGFSYFHNQELSGEEYKITGKLKADEPYNQLQALAFNNNLKIYEKHNTIYALTIDQQAKLPPREATYQLKYLRPQDMENIGKVLKPMLSPIGTYTMEGKTNTLVLLDNPDAIDRALRLLKKIDTPKDQVLVDVKIYRINRTKAKDVGFDWSSTVGGSGSAFTIDGVNRMLGLTTANPLTASPTNLVFNANQISAAFTALEDQGVTQLQNNPLLITEDNEGANISVIDRIPIITTTTSQGTSTSSVSEEVRYKIDESDSTDAETTREIGTTIFVTPTILPDRTIRLKMRPRTAQITGFRQSSSAGGNEYPEVRESTIDTIARIPDGSSLVVGGFFQESESQSGNSVPLLGDLPGLGFFFSNEKTETIKSSLIFVVTPCKYDPASKVETSKAHNTLYANTQSKAKKAIVLPDPTQNKLRKKRASKWKFWKKRNK